MKPDPTSGGKTPDTKSPGFSLILYAAVFGIATLFVVFYVMQFSTDEIAYRDLLTLIQRNQRPAGTNPSFSPETADGTQVEARSGEPARAAACAQGPLCRLFDAKSCQKRQKAEQLRR